MDNALVKNWNSVVGRKDVVYHVGDFAFGRDAEHEYIAKLAKELNGTIHLICGNHEKIAKAMAWRFASIKDYEEFEVEGQRIVLFHYGLRTWHKDLKGAWHLYGHSHGQLPGLGKSLDIGVDSWDYTPVKFKQLKDVMDKRAIGKHPMFESYSIEQSILDNK